MSRKGCLFLIFMVCAIIVIVGLVTANHGSQTASPATTPKPAVLSDGLREYMSRAEALAKELDTQKLSDTMFDKLKDEYQQEDYESAYAYYQENRNAMYQSAWAMNNVGLVMMQLGKYDEALTLYFAINLKTKGTQPESLLNLLVAGHALGFHPAELMRAAGVDATIFKRILQEKKYESGVIDPLIESLCYNILYMRMEEEAVGSTYEQVRYAPDADTILAQIDPYEKLLTQLEALPTKDKDVQELLMYFNQKLELQRENNLWWNQQPSSN